MKALVIASQHLAEEFRLKFPQLEAEFYTEMPDVPADADVAFLFNPVYDPEEFSAICQAVRFVFVNTVLTPLHVLATWFPVPTAQIAGFNGLPTFFNRSLLEVSLLEPATRTPLERICEELGTNFRLVADRTGMVTARVVCMIINEAYYTLQEGTASRDDIDLSMRLGVNYPHGPFEWAQRIGLDHVYELLKAVYEDSRDERYRMAPLLKEEALALGRQ